MTTRHNISHADILFSGSARHDGIFNVNKRLGAPMTPVYLVDLGVPIALDADGLVDDATSTELPNNTTITYTTADDGSSPFDNADTPAPSTIEYQGSTVSVWALDVPRNLSLVVTHSSSVVAMTCTITGYDEYLVKMVETLTATATGTSKTDAGAKAWMYIQSIAFASAGNATTNTATLGWGDILGLPYFLTSKGHLLSFGAPADELASATAVAGVTTTASATTGDVRGTVLPNTATDASAHYYALMALDPTSNAGLGGVAQYGG